jgi:hypothetical protein
MTDREGGGIHGAATASSLAAIILHHVTYTKRFSLVYILEKLSGPFPDLIVMSH